MITAERLAELKAEEADMRRQDELSALVQLYLALQKCGFPHTPDDSRLATTTLLALQHAIERLQDH